MDLRPSNSHLVCLAAAAALAAAVALAGPAHAQVDPRATPGFNSGTGTLPERDEVLLRDGTQRPTAPLPLQLDGARSCAAGDSAELTFEDTNNVLQICDGTQLLSWPAAIEGTGLPSAHAVVALDCDEVQPDAGTCYDGATPIEDAETALLAALPSGRRVIRVMAGVFTEQFSFTHGSSGQTWLYCPGNFAQLAEFGSTVITAPDNATGDVNWLWRGAGGIVDCSFKMTDDSANEVGLRIQTGFIVEHEWKGVNVNCGPLGPNAHCVEYIDQSPGVPPGGTGFFSFSRSNIVANCDSGTASDGTGAALYVDVQDGPFRELHGQFSWIFQFGADAIAGCRALEIRRSPLGDDPTGSNLNFVHVGCENGQTCLRLHQADTVLDFGPSYMRDQPVGKFVEAFGTGTGAEVTFHGIHMQEPTTPSTYGSIVPEGLVHIFYGDGTLSEPCFPGYFATNANAAGGTSPYRVCRNAVAGGTEWATVQLDP